MSHFLSIISKNEFENADPLCILISHKDSRTFGRLEVPPYKYFLSWQSNRVDPVVKLLDNGNYLFIGIDQEVVALDTKTARIKFKIGTVSLFKDVREVENTLKIECESSEIYLNASNLSLKKIVLITD
jgi:hypothetical protein